MGRLMGRAVWQLLLAFWYLHSAQQCAHIEAPAFVEWTLRCENCEKRQRLLTGGLHQHFPTFYHARLHTPMQCQHTQFLHWARLGTVGVLWRKYSNKLAIKYMGNTACALGDSGQYITICYVGWAAPAAQGMHPPAPFAAHQARAPHALRLLIWVCMPPLFPPTLQNTHTLLMGNDQWVCKVACQLAYQL